MFGEHKMSYPHIFDVRTSSFGEHEIISRECMLPNRRFWTVEQSAAYQPSATHPHFWQTCLFTIFPIISTTNRGSQFWENREKAGLSKMGMSELPTAVAYAFLNENSSFGAAVGNSSPPFDKPAFSRFSQLFQPRIVVHLLGKIVKRQVCQKGGWVADGWFGEHKIRLSSFVHPSKIFVWA